MGRPPTELRPYAHSAPRQPIDPEAAAQRTAKQMIAAYAKATGDTEDAPPPLTAWPLPWSGEGEDAMDHERAVPRPTSGNRQMSAQEITEINRKLTDLTRRVDALEAVHRPRAAAPAEPRPQVTQLGPPRSPPGPSADEVDQLLAPVWRAYSVLRPRESLMPDMREQRLDEYRAEFRNSVNYLSWVWRAAEPDARYAPSYWIGAVPGGATLAPFVAAAIICGVPFAPLDSYPHEMSLGLALGAAPRVSSRWRETLVAESMPQPVRIEQRYTAPHVSVLGGNSVVGD
jgi:hypothetical protein